MNESTKARCVGEPVSWLRLERYHLGEVDEPLRLVVKEHLDACAACRACLSSIEADTVPLPVLVLPKALPQPTPRRLRLSLANMSTAVGTLALAAAVFFGIGRDPLRAPSGGSSPVKGGDVDFALVRDDGVRIDDGTAVFRDGDRFKVLVTCPPSMHASFDVAVFDAQGTSFPLPGSTELACGNEVALAGAFRLTGPGEERVCIVWRSDRAVDRASVAEGGDESRCRVMHPATSDR